MGGRDVTDVIRRPQVLTQNKFVESIAYLITFKKKKRICALRACFWEAATAGKGLCLCAWKKMFRICALLEQMMMLPVRRGYRGGEGSGNQRNLSW